MNVPLELFFVEKSLLWDFAGPENWDGFIYFGNHMFSKLIYRLFLPFLHYKSKAFFELAHCIVSEVMAICTLQFQGLMVIVL